MKWRPNWEVVYKSQVAVLGLEPFVLQPLMQNPDDENLNESFQELESHQENFTNSNILFEILNTFGYPMSLIHGQIAKIDTWPNVAKPIQIFFYENQQPIY